MAKIKIGRRGPVVLTVAALFALFIVYEVGRCLECEFPYWPTLWMAQQTKTANGKRVVDLISERCGVANARQHWHHCTWCDVVYPQASNMAVRVDINDSDTNFYLFDWDFSRRQLRPITTRTVKSFPELVPAGYVVQLADDGNPQLYHNDQPCDLVPAHEAKSWLLPALP